MPTTSDDAADARSASNLASTSSPSQDGYHGVSLVTPATITQSQSQDYTNSTNEDTVDSPTAAILCSMRDFASPEIASPTRLSSPLLRRALDGTAQDGLKRHGQNLFEEKSKKKKKQEQTVNPTKSLFTFLRDPIIDGYCSTVGYKPPRTTDLIKKALNYFDAKRQATTKTEGLSTRSVSAAPELPTIRGDKRAKLFPSVEWSSPLRQPLLFNHRRLQLEDFVALPVGSSVVVLVSSSDPFFYLSWRPLLQAAYALSPTHCYKFGSSFYYSVELGVSTNSHCEAFCNGLVLAETTKYLCTETGGGALTLTPVYSSSKRDCGLQVKYHTVFHGSESFMVWGTGPKNNKINTQLRKMTNIKRRGAAFHRYIQELWGDSHQVHSLATYYDVLSERTSSALELSNYRAGQLSTARIRDNFAVDRSCPIFKRFCAHVDEVCYEAVRGCFGQFVPISAPILTQKTLTTLSHTFKADLPAFYTVISCMLN
jgi:hypothetical protein